MLVLGTNQPLSFGLLFLKHIGLFPNFAFSAVLGETLLPKGAYRPWDHFRFFIKNPKWSQDRYAPFGSRVSPNAKFEKRPICFKNSNPELKGCFFKKVYINYKNVYTRSLTYNIRYLTYKSTYFIYLLSYIE